MTPGRTQTGVSSYDDPHKFLFMRLHETGQTSSRLLDRDEKFSYRSEFVPFSCK